MEHESETIELDVSNYVSPECSCKIEDIARNVPHILEAAFDPVSNHLTVKGHKGMVTAKDVIKELDKCKVLCREGTPAHEMGNMEHEAMKTKMPGKHDHHQ